MYVPHKLQDSPIRICSFPVTCWISRAFYTKFNISPSWFLFPCESQVFLYYNPFSCVSCPICTACIALAKREAAGRSRHRRRSKTHFPVLPPVPNIHFSLQTFLFSKKTHCPPERHFSFKKMQHNNEKQSPPLRYYRHHIGTRVAHHRQDFS